MYATGMNYAQQKNYKECEYLQRRICQINGIPATLQLFYIHLKQTIDNRGDQHD